ncbi:MAG: peptidyl-prolyl cis-trans isomerase [Verrucomicrobia bacterium]|nr:peptidyl-prolyl cis-trans isomerase [Verrucomicrobiota bacterium]
MSGTTMKYLLLLISNLLLVGPLAWAQYRQPDLPPIPVEGFAATVNGRIITIGDVMVLAGPELERLQTSAITDDINERYLDIFKRALQARIEDALILEEFSTMEEAQFPEYLVDQEVDRVIRERFNNNRATFLEALSGEEMSMEDYRTTLRDQLIVRQLQQLEVFSKIAVSPKAVRELYEQEKDRYIEPAALLLRVITIRRVDPITGDPQAGAEAKLAALQEAMAAGDQPFSELAKTYSDDSFAKEGGLWGWRQPRDYLQTIREAVEPLQPGETSGVIETEAAWYILHVEDRREETTKSFEEVRDEIEGAIRQKEAQKLRDQWIERLRRKHYVHVYDGVPNPYATP